MNESCQLPDSSSSLEGIPPGVLCDAERSSIRFPDVLLVIIVFGCHNHTVGNKEWRVKTNTKLANQVTCLITWLSILNIEK